MIKKFYRVAILFIVSNLTIVLIFSCAIESSDVPPSNLNASSAANCRIMKHAMGESCIPQTSQRLVTISDFTLYHAVVLGIKPVGSVFDNWRDEIPAYLTDRKQEIEKIEKLGKVYQPNLEKILKLKPDLIISWGYEKANYSLLSQIAPTAMDTLESSGNDGWKEHFNFVAQVLDKEDAAKQAWNQYHQRIEKLKVALGDRLGDKTISVLTVAHDFANHASSKNSFVGSIFTDVGLKLAKAQDVYGGGGWIQFSSEQFVDFFDGDLLFVTITGDTDRKELEELQNNPFWKKLKAVRSGKVYVVDSLTWQGGNLLAANAVIEDLSKYLVNTDR
ncbi:MAG: iron-siderophore ABC transporter substrate-binding protein [Cyanobacteria bacterium P01_G01_bin.49]